MVKNHKETFFYRNLINFNLNFARNKNGAENENNVRRKKTKSFIKG